MKPSLSSRADLIRALAFNEPGLSAAMAELLGYQETPVALREQIISSVEPVSVSEPTDTGYKPTAVPFWRLETFAAVAPVERMPEPKPSDLVALMRRERRTTTPDFVPLVSKQMALTQLRKLAAMRRTTNDIDVDAVVEQLGRGDLLDQLPHRQRRAWGSTICIVEDRARRLVPYWLDQDYLVGILTKLYPPNGVTIARIWDGDDHPVIRWPQEQRGQPVTPLPGTIVLVLGDLGCLARQEEDLPRFWFQWGRQLREQGNSAVALVPAQTTEIAPDLARVWTIAPWGASGGAGAPASSQATTDAVQRLLTLLSPAVRLEPGLLRAVRGLLPEGRYNPGLEAHVWQDAAIASRHSVAASWDLDQRRVYQARFAEQSESLRGEVLSLIRTWRTNLYPAVWFEEINELDQQSHQLLDADDLEAAERFLPVLVASLPQREQLPVDTAAWIGRLLARWPTAGHHNPRVQRAVHRLYELVRPHAAETQAPGWYDPAITSPSDQPARRAELWQVADRLLVRTVAASSSADAPSVMRGSPLGIVHTASGEVKITSGPPELEENDFWQTGQPPAWAHSCGWDDFGPWATFCVGEVEQRLRWIPPGRFLMGSPADEEGRYDDEGSRHEVQLTRGFWLFDTPCTQALWQAVMDANPSEFKGANRPVEQVSWEDCQEFIAKLNERFPGLALRLPSEAEWEYACRAGTSTARYAEDVDAIAWYDKNSKGETHPVKQKQPNPWGLYDMLGNVAEWCHDGQRKYTKASQVDPLGPTDPGASRVIRGGHWVWVARDVRSAFRSALLPGDRYDDLGFRCASSSEHQPVQERPTWRAAQRKAEPAQTATRRPRLLDLDQQSSITIELPNDASFTVNTDRDRLRFGRLTLPKWASEIGRDQYGLWVTFEVAGVRQQMRWISPERFWMGSPDDEAGRSSNEGPRHEVQLTHGFWLFDTPCTQELWQAVMKKNPSRFKGKEWKERPVEQVSWEDCQKFISTLNAQLPGLALALPTEAEWEYACRAGTETARYAKDLDVIAWYVENSDNETHPVKQKQPNAWGLYDMLGNVAEWCHDGSRDYAEGVVVDPLGPTTAGAHRVIRGGVWVWVAQVVRSAFRVARPPGVRSVLLGFRCASSGQASRLESEPSGDERRAGVRQGGARADRRRTGKRGEPRK
ncbi:MAG: formylglycine-generating enzyme family protein [Candidatus Binatia bacterium]